MLKKILQIITFAVLVNMSQTTDLLATELSKECAFCLESCNTEYLSSPKDCSNKYGHSGSQYNSCLLDVIKKKIACDDFCKGAEKCKLQDANKGTITEETQDTTKKNTQNKTTKDEDKTSEEEDDS